MSLLRRHNRHSGAWAVSLLWEEPSLAYLSIHLAVGKVIKVSGIRSGGVCSLLSSFPSSLFALLSSFFLVQLGRAGLGDF